jgi:hypothetical protein
MWNVPPGMRIMPGSDGAGAFAHPPTITDAATTMSRKPRKHENMKTNLAGVVSCFRAFVAIKR